ncbi:MAG: Stage V sporulation protein D [Candidatus Dichloromethanomonas elyunquensis]|nr:MAG: Stage V sporulation protein D [Candidatus Dichloromethanomonas elyunquensis]
MKKIRGYFSREWVIYIFLIGVTLLIISKLMYLQIIDASELSARAATLKDNSQTMVSQRGMIADAQGNILAKSVTAKDIYADPKSLKKALQKSEPNITDDKITQKTQEIAQKLAEILGKDPKDILELILKDLSWVSLARQVDLAKAKQIDDLKIPGIGFTDTYKRVYPTGAMASSIMGIVNNAGDGVEGIEYAYNAELKGEKVLKPQNTSQNTGQTTPESTDIQSGYNLTLTLDSTIQHIVEQELDKIMTESTPQRAVILAMDPMTGKILGMASRPAFDPNDYRATDARDRKNLAISMIYEPGSTFKVITGAAALEENVVNADTLFSDPGYLNVGSRKITNWDSDQKAHGNISFADGLELSSNVVLAQVGKALGKDSFYTYLKSFGFGSKTKVDIAGEEQGLLVEKNMVKDIELATMSFGQANLVTPIQLLTAISAVANGGTLLQPYIVDKITNNKNELLVQNQPRVVREVISKTTSNSLTNILVDVVDKGTGSRAKIPGIKVAGKTGTAQKIDLNTGRYSDTDYIVSFVGYAPADNPCIAVLVVEDTPHGQVIQGGTLAGPHVKTVIENALQYYGIPVAASTPSNLSDLSRLSTPSKKENAPSKPSTPSRTPGQGEVLVPDLTGLTIRQAGEKLGKLDLHYHFQGSGLAAKQNPPPGSIVNQGDTIEVIFGGDNK